LLFFALGIDRQILRILAQSLVSYPPGSFQLTPGVVDAMVRLGGAMFSVGMRLALPVLALAILVDLSLALLGRLNAQLQLLTMTFPAKITTALLLLAWITAVFPRVYLGYAGRMLTTVEQILIHPHG
jgi:flagellar biosynthetic protein FliR